MGFRQTKMDQTNNEKYFNKRLIMSNEDEEIILIHTYAGYVNKN